MECLSQMQSVSQEQNQPCIPHHYVKCSWYYRGRTSPVPPITKFMAKPPAKADRLTGEKHGRLNLSFTDISAFTMKSQRNRYLSTSLLRFIPRFDEDWSTKGRMASLNQIVSIGRELQDLPGLFSIVLFFVPLCRDGVSFSYGNCWCCFHKGKVRVTFWPM